jgi:site-specific recombinase XerD
MKTSSLESHLYRRHGEDCEHFAKPNAIQFTRCQCPIWFSGSQEGHARRFSLKTRDWARAIERLKKDAAPAPAKPLDKAINEYLGEVATHTKPKTQVSYRAILEALANFVPKNFPLEQLTDDTLSRFFQSRNHFAANTQRLANVTVRQFGKFCVRKKWITENPASNVPMPPAEQGATMPFTPEEVDRILRAADEYEGGTNPALRREIRLRARAMVLVLLYSGMRISDVSLLRRDHVDLASGKILRKMMKTGRQVYVELNPVAVEALRVIDRPGNYFFWTGEKATPANEGTVISRAQSIVYRILRNAEIEGGHPHRFRDTFAVEALSNGVDIRTVQLLLGHASVTTTEKHYAPFVAAFQDRLNAATRSMFPNAGKSHLTLVRKA